MTMKSSELDRFGIKDSKKKSMVMAKLKEKRVIAPTTEGGRIYTISFGNNYLLRVIMEILKQKGFVSNFPNQNQRT